MWPWITEVGAASPWALRLSGARQAHLLGIDWGHLSNDLKVLDPNDNPVPEKYHVKENSGFAGVVPAWKIAEILYSKEQEQMREEHRKKVEQDEPVTSTLDSVDPEPGDSEFDRFEDLTRKLVNTPKSEVDEKRRDES